MKQYEIMFILDPKEDGTSLRDRIKTLFKEHGAVVQEEQELGLKKLAYPISKKDRGVYVLMNVQMDSTKNEILKREFNFIEPIFRYMFVNLE